jgi:chromatin segregation and condensation protein Rec8/ScpA/Scc1 (kleisin family)
MTRDELVVAFALTRLDHPTLDLEEVAALLVRRIGPQQALHLAAQNLATRDELRGDVFAAAVEHVLRTLLLLRDGGDD